ncbi:hypothetical protein RFI_10243 [Reticulomyxa filosa]|uniref:Uncharacterized protein n=1 Tax=Reticulomyxa filosa TaxID=46433 RepID=X6NLX4_RETFI|nr:hypothetical protein RFI_10243 [Reticulomyxa filosa]|eukprot:ETO26893.1 hypothetical protein RFI_10243 [Reticulomyxa filosa]
MPYFFLVDLIPNPTLPIVDYNSAEKTKKTYTWYGLVGGSALHQDQRYKFDGEKWPDTAALHSIASRLVTPRKKKQVEIKSDTESKDDGQGGGNNGTTTQEEEVQEPWMEKSYHKEFEDINHDPILQNRPHFEMYLFGGQFCNGGPYVYHNTTYRFTFWRQRYDTREEEETQEPLQYHDEPVPNGK